MDRKAASRSCHRGRTEPAHGCFACTPFAKAKHNKRTPVTMSASDLQWSVKNGDLDAVTNIVENEGVDVNAELSGGRFPLHFAADMGQLDVIKYLVSKGAEVDKTDKHGITPVLAAIWEGHAKVVEFLLEAGAAKDGKTPSGDSYLSAAESSAVQALLK